MMFVMEHLCMGMAGPGRLMSLSSAPVSRAGLLKGFGNGLDYSP